MNMLEAQNTLVSILNPTVLTCVYRRATIPMLREASANINTDIRL